MHKHHIIPRHAGGTDDPANLVLLTVDEHAEAHLKLYEEHGRWQDKLAWKGLSGQIGKEGIIKELQSENNAMKRPEVVAKLSGDNHWSKRTGAVHNWVDDNPMKDPEVVAKLSGDNHWSKRTGAVHNWIIEHPKGMLGKKHSTETKSKMKGRVPHNKGVKSLRGWYNDGAENYLILHTDAKEHYEKGRLPNWL